MKSTFLGTCRCRLYISLYIEREKKKKKKKKEEEEEEVFIYPSSYIVFVFWKCTCSGLIDILIQAQVLILWGFLNTLIKFLSMVWVWMGGIIGRLIFKIEILKFGFFT